MKKIIATIALTLVVTAGFSQKCKYTINKKDALTGKEVKETYYLDVGSNIANGTFYWLHFLKQSDDTYYIFYKFGVYGQVFNVVPKNQEFKLKLANGNIVTFQSLNEVNPVTGGSTNIVTDWEMKCSISKEDLLLISTNKPVALSTLDFSKNKGVSVDFSNNEANYVSKYASCILQ